MASNACKQEPHIFVIQAHGEMMPPTDLTLKEGYNVITLTSLGDLCWDMHGMLDRAICDLYNRGERLFPPNSYSLTDEGDALEDTINGLLEVAHRKDYRGVDVGKRFQTIFGWGPARPRRPPILIRNHLPGDNINEMLLNFKQQVPPLFNEPLGITCLPQGLGACSINMFPQRESLRSAVSGAAGGGGGGGGAADNTGIERIVSESPHGNYLFLLSEIMDLYGPGTYIIRACRYIFSPNFTPEQIELIRKKSADIDAKRSGGAATTGGGGATAGGGGAAAGGGGATAGGGGGAAAAAASGIPPKPRLSRRGGRRTKRRRRRKSRKRKRRRKYRKTRRRH